MEIDFDSWELVDTTTSVPQTLDPSEESTLEHFDWTEPKELDPHYFDYPYHPKSPHLQEDKDEALILVVQDKLKGINADAKSKSRHFRQSSLDMFEVITCPSCLAFFKDPVALICGHALCQECITAIAHHTHSDNIGSITCPVCHIRNPITIIERMKPSITIGRLTRMLLLKSLDGDDYEASSTEVFPPLSSTSSSSSISPSASSMSSSSSESMFSSSSSSSSTSSSSSSLSFSSPSSSSLSSSPSFTSSSPISPSTGSSAPTTLSLLSASSALSPSSASPAFSSSFSRFPTSQSSFSPPPSPCMSLPASPVAAAPRLVAGDSDAPSSTSPFRTDHEPIRLSHRLYAATTASPGDRAGGPSDGIDRDKGRGCNTNENKAVPSSQSKERGIDGRKEEVRERERIRANRGKVVGEEVGEGAAKNDRDGDGEARLHTKLLRDRCRHRKRDMDRGKDRDRDKDRNRDRHRDVHRDRNRDGGRDICNLIAPPPSCSTPRSPSPHTMSIDITSTSSSPTSAAAPPSSLSTPALPTLRSCADRCSSDEEEADVVDQLSNTIETIITSFSSFTANLLDNLTDDGEEYYSSEDALPFDAM